MKIKGAEAIAFYRAWPMGEDWYHEDSIIEDPDCRGIDPAKEYDLFEAIGTVIWQGRGNPPSSIEIHGVDVRIEDHCLDLDAAFKAWRGDDVIVFIEVPKADLGKLEAVCTENGWTRVSQ